MCSLAEIGECRSISQRLRISPDERLEKFVNGNDIVDIDVDVPHHVTKVVAVMHNRDHYAVMVIDISEKKVVIFNGLYKNLHKWMDHVVSGMKRCMLLSLNGAIHHTADEPNLSNVGGSRHPQEAIHGYL
jgi:hypothetical protein